MRRALFVFLALHGCSSTPRTATLDVSVGHETGAFGQAPAVTDVLIRATDSSGATVAETRSAPGETFSLGEFPLTELVGIEASGSDADGTVRMRGKTMGLVLGELASDVLPLFIQRIDAFARPPGVLGRSHEEGAAAVVGERYLLLTGGRGEEPARATFYDLLSLGPAEGGLLPRIARTIVSSATGSALLLIGPSSSAPEGLGGASWVDFDEGTVSDVALPEGLDSFDEIAGGRVVVADDGASYVVGGTRREQPSDAVLVVRADRTLGTARLSSARNGAAATWLADVGLVVAGGSGSAPGLETLAQGATKASPRPFPSDSTVGASLIPTGGPGEVVLVGGVEGYGPASLRVADARCATTCEMVTLDANGLGSALVDCIGYLVAPGQFLSTCRDASDARTRVFRVSTTPASVSELALREPRRGATPLPTPLGTLALMGGVRMDDDEPALTVELWSPP